MEILKNIYTFIDWYKDQCKYMNKTTDLIIIAIGGLRIKRALIIILNKRI